MSVSLIGTATLTGNYPGPTTVLGIVVGPFLVHKHSLDPLGWCVTHSKTGAGFSGAAYCCILKAISVAETAATMLDWDRPLEVLNEDPALREVPSALRAVKCPSGCTP
jgi:hypothetical protein